MNFLFLFLILSLQKNFTVIEEKKSEDFFYDSLFIEIKSKNESVLQAEYLRTKRNRNVPLIVIFPILGPWDPSKFLSSILIVHFNFKVDILILSQKRYIFWRNSDSINTQEDLIKELRKMNEKSLLRLRALSFFLDCLKEKGRCEKIGIIGISYGGIEGTVFALKYKKIDCVIIINAGGDIGGIITESVEKEIKDNLKRIKEKIELTDEELKEIIRENLKDLDPLNLSMDIPTSKFLIVSSFGDRTVPYKYQKILWKHLNKPKRLLLPYGHRGVIFYFFKILKEILKMLDKTLRY